MEQPSYYSITPAVVRYDADLKPNEKLLYGEITALSNKFGYCTASNGYFANLYNAKKETVSRWISHLNKKGYIKVKVIRTDGKIVKQRRIYVSDIGEVLTKKSIGYCKKNQHPIDQKVKENITRDNNTSINISSSKKEEDDGFINEIIEGFKKKTFADVTSYQHAQITKLLGKMPKDVADGLVEQVIEIMPIDVKDPTAYLIKSLMNAR